MKHLQRQPPTVSLSGLSLGDRPTNLIIPTLSLLLILVAGFVIQALVEQEMRTVIGNNLKTIRDSSVSAVRLWFREEELNCRRVATVARDAALRFEATAKKQVLSKSYLETDQDYKHLRHQLCENIYDSKYLGWVLLQASTGTVLVASGEDIVGKRSFELHATAMNKASAGQTTMSIPFRSSVDLLPSAVGDGRDASKSQATKAEEDGCLRGFAKDSPIMAAVAPISDDNGETRAVLAILMSPLDDFASILSVCGGGRSGHTYAFDRSGVMVSRCRHEDELRLYGLIPNDPDSNSILEVQLRNPEVSLRDGRRSLKPLENQPFTTMALDATRGGSDLQTEGYADYRGVTVIGAWAWLPDYGLGLATEVDSEEAYRPLRVLRYSYLGLFSLLLLAGLLLAFTTARVGRAELKAKKETKIARKLGQYQLEEKLGVGGMGTVYKGQHALLMRPVAIKVLDSQGSDTQSLIRFQREVELTSQLHNPHTIVIYDFGQTKNGDFYYVMEYLDGMDLGMLVRQYGSLSAARVISILIQICGSLIEAHGKGLIHRDIKPANIMLCECGGIYDFAKLLDFGLVKESNAENANITHEGSLTGTPMYMSPEAIRNAKTVDPRSDIYSVGAVGYYLVTGKPLFDVTGTVDAILNQFNEEPDRPGERAGKSISRDFEDLLMRCLSKDPDDRPESAAELARMLEGCQDAGVWDQRAAKRWWAEVFRGWQRQSTILTGKDSILQTVIGEQEGMAKKRDPDSDPL